MELFHRESGSNTDVVVVVVVIDVIVVVVVVDVFVVAGVAVVVCWLCIVLWLILIHNELIYVKARTEGPGLSRALLSISLISALGSNYRNADYR